MGNKESKKNSDSINVSTNNTSNKKTKKQKDLKNNKNQVSSAEVSQVSIPVDINASLKSKQFLNDLSLFIVKAYDTNFQGTFNEFMISCLAEECIRDLDIKHNGEISRGLQSMAINYQKNRELQTAQ